MILYPAIDIKEGRCVRLLQGKEDEKTVYGDNPAQMAEKWCDAGAEFLHVVDLDGAFSGQGKNGEAVQEIVQAAAGVPVQLGGGIRNMEDVEKRFEWGVTRVIIGTAAIANPEFLQEVAKRYPSRIVAGIDAKDGYVALKGWVELSEISALDLAMQLMEIGIEKCVYTDISKDGMMLGPNLKATLDLQKESGMDVIASGGIASLEDIRALREAGIQGAIIGKALYEGAFTLEEALAESK